MATNVLTVLWWCVVVGTQVVEGDHGVVQVGLTQDSHTLRAKRTISLNLRLCNVVPLHVSGNLLSSVVYFHEWALMHF